MYIPAVALVFAATTVKATVVLAQRAPSELVSRDVSQGWSLQSGSGPTDAHSCGNGAYCPISLHCNSMVNNHQVAACCSTSSDCRGEVENAPKCADPAWNLWVGYDGNGFCCEAGLVGVYDISKSVAGTCVSGENVGSLRSAVLTSTGIGAEATPASKPTSRSSSTAAAAIATDESDSTSTPSAPASAATSPASSKGTATGSSSIPSSSATSSPSSSATTSSSSTIPTTNSAQILSKGLSFMGAAVLAVAAM